MRLAEHQYILGHLNGTKQAQWKLELLFEKTTRSIVAVEKRWNGRTF